MAWMSYADAVAGRNRIPTSTAITELRMEQKFGGQKFAVGTAQETVEWVGMEYQAAVDWANELNLNRADPLWQWLIDVNRHPAGGYAVVVTKQQDFDFRPPVQGGAPTDPWSFDPTEGGMPDDAIASLYDWSEISGPGILNAPNYILTGMGLLETDSRLVSGVRYRLQTVGVHDEWRGCQWYAANTLANTLFIAAILRDYKDRGIRIAHEGGGAYTVYRTRVYEVDERPTAGVIWNFSIGGS